MKAPIVIISLVTMMAVPIIGTADDKAKLIELQTKENIKRIIRKYTYLDRLKYDIDDYSRIAIKIDINKDKLTDERKIDAALIVRYKIKF